MKKIQRSRMFVFVAMLACSQALAEVETIVKDMVSPEYKAFYKGVSDVLLEGISEKDVNRVVGGVVDDVINDVIDDVIKDITTDVVDEVLEDTINDLIISIITDVVDDVLVITEVKNVSDEQAEQMSNSVQICKRKFSIAENLAGGWVKTENISLKE